MKPSDITPPSALLLHTCCAPCATHCIETVKKTTAVTLFFSNSNIAPYHEYCVRRDAALMLAEVNEIECVIDEYDHAAWLEWIKGFEAEPEKGMRCEKCFAFSLERTALYATSHDFDAFTTTLTVSPHKMSNVLFKIGGMYPGFLPYDFKKENGFARSIALSKEYDLYRQTYCGCEFSLQH
jgi:epoxyqueuosine reductase